MTPARAERAFVRAREIDPARSCRRRWAWRACICSGARTSAAADLLERTLANNPGDRYAMQLLGTAYRRLGRVAEAEFALAVGESGEPAWPDPWTDEMLQFRRGFAVRLKDATQYFVAGRMAEAMALLQQLRQREAGRPRAARSSRRGLRRRGQARRGRRDARTGRGHEIPSGSRPT